MGKRIINSILRHNALYRCAFALRNLEEGNLVLNYGSLVMGFNDCDLTAPLVNQFATNRLCIGSSWPLVPLEEHTVQTKCVIVTALGEWYWRDEFPMFESVSLEELFEKCKTRKRKIDDPEHVECGALCKGAGKSWFRIPASKNTGDDLFCSSECMKKGKPTAQDFCDELIHLIPSCCPKDPLFPDDSEVTWFDEEFMQKIQYCDEPERLIIYYRTHLTRKLLDFCKVNNNKIIQEHEGGQRVSTLANGMYFCKVNNKNNKIGTQFLQEYEGGQRDNTPWSGYLAIEGNWEFRLASTDTLVKQVNLPKGSLLLWRGDMGIRLKSCDESARGFWFNTFVAGVEKDNSTFENYNTVTEYVPPAATGAAASASAPSAASDEAASVAALPEPSASTTASAAASVSGGAAAKVEVRECIPKSKGLGVFCNTDKITKGTTVATFEGEQISWVQGDDMPTGIYMVQCDKDGHFFLDCTNCPKFGEDGYEKCI